MRRRERAYALVLGTICTLSLLGGAWPFPLLAFALIEAAYSTVELAARSVRACAAGGELQRRATGSKRLEVSSAVLHEHLASG